MPNYYLDESGNTGDLIQSNFSLDFGGQPLFSLACVGEGEGLVTKLTQLKEKYGIQNELKSSEIYSSKPKLYLELVAYLVGNNIPILVELTDKKFCIITNLINSMIIPYYAGIDETNGKIQVLRNLLADILWRELPDEYIVLFSQACIYRNQAKISELLEKLSVFFGSEICNIIEKKHIKELIDNIIDDFSSCCSEHGEIFAVEHYLPLPDLLKKNKRKSKYKNINILPHVFSFFNIVGRLNNYHHAYIKDMILIHDEQKEFDDILEQSKKYILQYDFPENYPPIPNCDLNLVADFELKFIKSDFSEGVQIADLIAGFCTRFFNEVFYQKKKIDPIYFLIFEILSNYQKSLSPLGINFVLPENKQKEIFSKFHF